MVPCLFFKINESKEQRWQLGGSFWDGVVRVGSRCLNHPEVVQKHPTHLAISVVVLKHPTHLASSVMVRSV